MIASVPQIGAQPAPAKLPPGGASPSSFAQVMEQHQAPVHGMPDEARGQNPSDSRPASSKTTSSPLGLVTDRPGTGKADKKSDDSQDNPKQDSHDSTSANALLAQIVAPITKPPAPLPAAPAQPADAVTTSSTSPSPASKPSATVATPALAQALPSARFLNVLHEGLNTKTADALSPRTNTKIQDGKAEKLPEDTGSVDTIPNDTSDSDTKALSSVAAQTAPELNALMPSAKVAAARQLPKDAGLSQSKSTSPVDVSQQPNNGYLSHVDASKPDKVGGVVHLPHNNPSSVQSQSSANNPADLSTVLATTDPISTTKTTEIKELKLPTVAPQPTSNPKQVPSNTLSPQTTSQVPTPKEANATHAGKEEKKDDDYGDTLQSGQQVPSDTPKGSTAPQPHSSFSHAVAQATTVKDHVPQPASKDLTPGTLAGLHAAETPGPEAASAAVLLHSKILQRIGQSELRVGIQAGEFGNVDIRTSMSRNQVVAEISADHGELGRVLAAELPSLQNKLAEHQIPPASLVLQTQTSGSFADSGQHSGNWQRTPPAQNVFNSYAAERGESPSFVAPELTGTGSGLDIHM